MWPKSFLLPAAMVLAALGVAVVMLFVVGTPDGERPAVPGEPAAGLSPRPPSPRPDGAGFGRDNFSSASPTARAPADEASVEDAYDPALDGSMDPPMQPWEAAINQILESDEENQQVAMRLLALAPTLPSEGQVEAVQHIINLTDDDNYQNAAALLLNPATAEDVAEVLYSDVLNRPNNVKLPVMVSILRAPGHRMRAETLSTLQIFLGEDLGDNPEVWSQAVQNFLAREAQEEAAAEVEVDEVQ